MELAKSVRASARVVVSHGAPLNEPHAERFWRVYSWGLAQRTVALPGSHRKCAQITNTSSRWTDGPRDADVDRHNSTDSRRRSTFKLTCDVPHDAQNLAPGPTFGVAQQLQYPPRRPCQVTVKVSVSVLLSARRCEPAHPHTHTQSCDIAVRHWANTTTHVPLLPPPQPRIAPKATRVAQMPQRCTSQGHAGGSSEGKSSPGCSHHLLPRYLCFSAHRRMVLQRNVD